MCVTVLAVISLHFIPSKELTHDFISTTSPLTTHFPYTLWVVLRNNDKEPPCVYINTWFILKKKEKKEFGCRLGGLKKKKKKVMAQEQEPR